VDTLTELRPTYWMSPVATRRTLAADACLRLWLKRGYWGFFRSNIMREKLRPGDWVAFYGSQIGVLAYAQVAGRADTMLDEKDWPEPGRPRANVFKLPVSDVTWLPSPVLVPPLVGQLLSFRDKRPAARRNWAWFVNSTRRIPEADFRLLTRS
jgi:hypothetical protein